MEEFGTFILSRNSENSKNSYKIATDISLKSHQILFPSFKGNQVSLCILFLPRHLKNQKGFKASSLLMTVKAFSILIFLLANAKSRNSNPLYSGVEFSVILALK